jgi:hypothetical protein
MRARKLDVRDTTEERLAAAAAAECVVETQTRAADRRNKNALLHAVKGVSGPGLPKRTQGRFRACLVQKNFKISVTSNI